MLNCLEIIFNYSYKRTTKLHHNRDAHCRGLQVGPGTAFESVTTDYLIEFVGKLLSARCDLTSLGCLMVANYAGLSYPDP